MKKFNKKEYEKKRIENLKTQGKCHCGKDVALGKLSCQECLDIHKKYHENRKAQGKCVNCSKNAILGKTKCQDCLNYTKEYNKKRNKRCKILKKCVNCNEDALINRVCCQKCLNKANERNKKRRATNKEKNLLLRAKYRAKQHNLEFNIEISDIKIPECCPVLKKSLSGSGLYTPSIDRIDNNKGYIKGNIQVISKKANMMKNTATPEELLRFSEYYLKNIKVNKYE